MRRLLLCFIAAAALAARTGLAQQPQQPPPTEPRFQTRIDLITIDVAALDRDGRPVGDLRPRDFVVKVDGKPREVVSAELVKIDRAQPVEPPAGSVEALVATNLAATTGRRVVIAVDQTLLAPGLITPLLRTAGRFVDELTPADHAALVAFPEPGPRVDFTIDKARVREAMQRVVGQPPMTMTRRFTLGLWEAQQIDQKEKSFVDYMAEPEAMWRTMGPTMRRVMERGCDGVLLQQLLTDLAYAEMFKQCVRDLSTQAFQQVVETRQDAAISLRRLESFLKELIPIEGPKSMVLVSGGLVIENPAMLDEAIRLAASARTSINVVAVEPDREREIRDVPNGQSPLVLQDRALELEALDTVADRTGGRMHRLTGRGEGIFERLATELSAWYVVAVERRPGDPERQRIAVEVKRRGVTARSHRTVVAASAVNSQRPGEEVLRDALSSPIPISGVPLRVSTFTQRDAATGKYRLHVAAQVGQPGEWPREFSVGYVVMNDENRVVASLGRKVQLTSPGGAKNQPLHFDTALGIEPGVYSLRFGVVDPEGRRGTVVRRVSLETPAADVLATSDLIVGNVPRDGEVMHPSVEPHVDAGNVAAYLELYLPPAPPDGLTVSLDIAEGESSPALTTRMLNIGAGPHPGWRLASGAVETSVLPGRYIARATIRRDGVPLRVVSRPFVIERSDTPSRRSADRPRGVTISADMQRRTAAYIGNVVGAMANVVAQEDFVLSDPDRKVTADFMLVRYPGSDQDLLTFRDVTHVNGTAVPGRQEHLEELFFKPFALVRDRVRQITLASSDHVPSVLNPIFVVAFLQADFQGRYEFTVSEAGPDWPREVKAVTFVEVARPTVLRTGPQGDLDVPARGTAWIEEGTGRVLQTELLVGTGRSTTTVVTKFALDKRLQIMVPEQMRTKNPTGVATYSNFRRFSISTKTVIPEKKP